MFDIESLIGSGRIVDIMLLVLFTELVVVTAYRRVTGAGIAFWPLVTNLGAGGSLMLALRASLSDAGWQWVAAWLVSSLVFHVADQAARWQRRHTL